MNHTYIVKVIHRESNEVVKSLDVIGQVRAGKVANGLGINLNHDMYYVTMTVKEL